MKAITTFFSLFILLFLCLPPFAWSGNGYRLPPLVTDEQKLAFLLEAKNHVPKLFSDAAQYDIDLFKLLDDEQSLVETLKTHPQYDHLFQEKHYYDLTVTPPREGIPIGVLEIKPEAIQAWREELQKTVQDAKTRGLQGPKELKRHIQSLVTEEQAVLLQGAQANLGELGKLPPKPTAEQRSQQTELNACFKEYPELLGKYRCISNHWIRLSTLPGFQSAQLTLEKTQKIIQALEAQDQKMKALHLLAAVHPLPGTPPVQTWDDAERTIAQLNQDRLIHLDDKIDALKPILKDVLGKTEAETLDRALTSVHGRIQSVVNQTQATQRMAKKPVRITQVLPQLGIFRGCTGGDCSSQYSFPYPNDPNEMVFFIDDPTNDPEKGTEKKLKGYVSATQVKLPNGENALYVITISGNKVNAEDTEMILRGLAAKKQELGVSHILLPPIFRQGALINFPEIRGVMSAHARGKREEKIHYNNSDLREKIEKYKSDFNNGKYDHQDQNSSAVELDYKTNPVTVGLVSHEDQRLEPKQLSAYTHEEILEFLMDMNHSNRRDAIAKILKIESLTRFNDVTSLFALLASCEEKKGSKPLSVAGLKSNTIRYLEAFNINGEQFLSKHPQYLYPGITRCNDSFEKSHIETTAILIAHDIKNKLNLITRSNPSILKTQRDALNQTQAFLALKTKLLKQLEDKDNQSIRVASAQALAIMKPTDPAVHQALVHALHHDQDPDVRISAAEALGEIKPEDPAVHQALAIALTDRESRFVRLTATQALKAIKPKDPAVHQALVNALIKDAELQVRMTAAEALGEIDPQDPKIQKELAENILKLVMDLNHAKRVGDIRRILNLPGLIKFHKIMDLIDVLNFCRNSKDKFTINEFTTRVENILTNFGIEGKQYISTHPHYLYPCITECTDSFEPNHIERTAELLAEDIKSDRHLTRSYLRWIFHPLVEHNTALNQTRAFVEMNNSYKNDLKDPKIEIRLKAASRLSELTPQDVTIHHALADTLKEDQDEEVRSYAVSALKAIKPKNIEVQKALVHALLTDSNDQIRIKAVEALEATKSNEIVIKKALIQVLLRDPNDQLRLKAAEALISIMSPQDIEIQRALARAALHDQKENIRLYVTESLEASTDIEVNRSLAHAIRDQNEEVRLAAKKILMKKKLQDTEIHRALVDAIKDERPEIRKTASELLIRLRPTDPKILRSIQEARNNIHNGISNDAEALYDSLRERNVDFPEYSTEDELELYIQSECKKKQNDVTSQRGFKDFLKTLSGVCRSFSF